jgi:hypothetical protein
MALAPSPPGLTVQNERCDRQGETDGIDGTERENGGTVTRDASIAVQTSATARKNPEYCALTSLIPPAFTIPSPSLAAKLSGAVALLHVVSRQNSTLITRTAAPKTDGMVETFPMRG